MNPTLPNSDVRLPQQSDQIDPQKLADLIAADELPFPRELPAAEALHLAELVRVRRRKQLMRFIARQMARAMLNADTNREINHEEETPKV